MDGSYDGASPLGAAAYAGHITVVRYLGDRGCDTELADEDGDTPLSAAASEGHFTIVSMGHTLRLVVPTPQPRLRCGFLPTSSAQTSRQRARTANGRSIMRLHLGTRP